MLIYRELRVMVFNATFNNSSVISWRAVLLVGETIEKMDNFGMILQVESVIGIKHNINYDS
jgi:hypothetical protein